MTQAPIDELLKHCSSIYKLVVIAAKRAKELSEGAPKLVEADLKKVSSIAIEEIRQGKVVYQPEEPDASEEKTKKGRARSAARAEAVSAGGKKKKS